MPARTNDFQAIVYFVKKHIAADAVVRESAILADRITGEPREVDVLITGTVAGQELTIGIEAREHKRRQGVEWVEQAANKHSRLPIHQTVLVSASGFTESAERLAAKLGVELVTPGQEISATGPLADLGLQAEAREVTWTGEVDVRAQCRVENGELFEIELGHETLLFASDGAQLCTVETLARELHQFLDPATLGSATVLAGEDSNWLRVQLEPVLARHPRTGHQTTVHLMPNGPPAAAELPRIATVQIAYAAQLRVIPMPLSWHKLQEVDYAVAKATVLDQEAMIVVSQGASHPTTSIRMTDSDRKVTDLDDTNVTRVQLTEEQARQARQRAGHPIHIADEDLPTSRA
ncbi:hypothetical protein ACFVWG_29535 [Kribbella sp. NPDC058245]|uniref:hypothetical protein n=1 Tax=Kribbella sp. NPDC058245 TaxID=3346399 RepID=UPI0036E6EFD1